MNSALSAPDLPLQEEESVVKAIPAVSPTLVESQSLPQQAKPPTPPPEYSVLFVGTHYKDALFDKLLCVAEKYERHIQYHDTCYLYFNFTGQGRVVIELNDPGMEHTGAREMAVRKAAAVILCYAAYSPSSYHQLATLADDFKPRRNGAYPPVLLICNEDPSVLAEEERKSEVVAPLLESPDNKTAEICVENEADLQPTTFPSTEEALCPPNFVANNLLTTSQHSGQQSSTSEGYESQVDPDDDDEEEEETDEADDQFPRRPHLQNLGGAALAAGSQPPHFAAGDGEAVEDVPAMITREQGEALAKLFGPRCEFLPLKSFSDYGYDEASKLMESLISKILLTPANGPPSPNGTGGISPAGLLKKVRKARRKSVQLLKKISSEQSSQVSTPVQMTGGEGGGPSADADSSSSPLASESSTASMEMRSSGLKSGESGNEAADIAAGGKHSKKVKKKSRGKAKQKELPLESPNAAASSPAELGSISTGPLAADSPHYTSSSSSSGGESTKAPSDVVDASSGRKKKRRMAKLYGGLGKLSSVFAFKTLRDGAGKASKAMEEEAKPSGVDVDGLPQPSTSEERVEWLGGDEEKVEKNSTADAGVVGTDRDEGATEKKLSFPVESQQSHHARVEDGVEGDHNTIAMPSAASRTTVCTLS